RQALVSTLFGAGSIGLRALATGLPAALLVNPRKALAEGAGACTAPTKAQFFIFSTSANGDPINADAPGPSEDPGIWHNHDPPLAGKPMKIEDQPFTASKPWTELPQDVLDRLTFWHLMTNTPVHGKEPDVLKLMGATAGGEMLPSLLAKYLAPC